MGVNMEGLLRDCLRRLFVGGAVPIREVGPNVWRLRLMNPDAATKVARYVRINYPASIGVDVDACTVTFRL
jgi:hypothetical protein